MRANTVDAAYFEALANYDREVWTSGDAVPYVPRTSALDGLPRPIHERMEASLRREHHARFVLTGQEGCGKSTELAQLRARLAGDFSVVVVDGSEVLNLDRYVDVRFVLVAIAAALARALVDQDRRFTASRGIALSTGGAVREWVRILLARDELPDPTKVDPRAFLESVGEALTGVSTNSRTDDQLRDGLKRTEVSATRSLVVHLADELATLGGREVIVLIDDLDEITDPDSWRHLYHDHLVTLMGLPFRWVLTMPHALAYVPEVSAPPDRLVVLPNIKVVTRAAPDTLLAPARAYFRQLADGLLAPTLLDDDACARAAVLAAGIPREFVRVLRAAFGAAYEHGLDHVGLNQVAEAEAQLRRELQRFHADPKVKRSLELARARPGALDEDQRRLMAPLLLVEYTNGEQWYDVNPLLVAEYEDRLRRRAARLGKSRDDEEALVADILGSAKG